MGLPACLLLLATPALAQMPPPGAFKISERATPPLAQGEFALYPDKPPLPANAQWMTINGDPAARNVTHPTLIAFRRW